MQPLQSVTLLTCLISESEQRQRRPLSTRQPVGWIEFFVAVVVLAGAAFEAELSDVSIATLYQMMQRQSYPPPLLVSLSTSELFAPLAAATLESCNLAASVLLISLAAILLVTRVRPPAFTSSLKTFITRHLSPLIINSPPNRLSVSVYSTER